MSAAPRTANRCTLEANWAGTACARSDGVLHEDNHETECLTRQPASQRPVPAAIHSSSPSRLPSPARSATTGNENDRRGCRSTRDRPGSLLGYVLSGSAFRDRHASIYRKARAAAFRFRSRRRPNNRKHPHKISFPCILRRRRAINGSHLFDLRLPCPPLDLNTILSGCCVQCVPNDRAVYKG